MIARKETTQGTAMESNAFVMHNGIAVPHARIRSLDRVSITIGFSPQGIDFGAPDGGLTHIIVLLLFCGFDYVVH